MKKQRKSIDHDTLLKRFIVASLRRATLYWPPRNDAIKLGRIDRGLYQCNICKKANGRKEIRVDHIQPVVKLSGFTTWDDYLNRMFPKAEGFQILCLDCNKKKTDEENILRRIHKRVDKKKKK